MQHQTTAPAESRLPMADEISVRALQSAMQRQLADDTPPTNVCSSELTAAIRTLCTAARRQGLRPEHVVILFQNAWASLPITSSQLAGGRRTELLENAITLCIKSYYAAAD